MCKRVARQETRTVLRVEMLGWMPRTSLHKWGANALLKSAATQHLLEKRGTFCPSYGCLTPAGHALVAPQCDRALNVCALRNERLVEGGRT